MNVATIDLIATILQLGERAFVQVQDILQREKAGKPLSDVEIQTLKADSDVAHRIIQGWTPPSA